MSGIIPALPSDEPYNSTTWDESFLAPTQNAIRDYIEGTLLPMLGVDTSRPQCLNVLAIEGNGVLDVIDSMAFVIRNGTSEVMRVITRATIEGDGSLVIRNSATVEVS
jgi:hypothetical protein